MRVSTQVSIPRRFNGPLGSGNGGYCSGVFAGLVDGHAAVNLRRPIPLERPLDVVSDDGEARVMSGEELIAEVQACPPPAISVPDPVDPERARRAGRGYRGAEEGVFSECFVCGLARADSLGVFAGPVEDRRMVASPWAPPEWVGGEDGTVRPELVWAVLDCPTVFAAFLGSEQDPLAYLVRMNAELREPVPVDGEHVAVAWPAWREGRKHRAGSALFSADGKLLAVAEALMIEPAEGRCRAESLTRTPTGQVGVRVRPSSGGLRGIRERCRLCGPYGGSKVDFDWLGSSLSTLYVP